jgi:hypothetical protein
MPRKTKAEVLEEGLQAAREAVRTGGNLPSGFSYNPRLGVFATSPDGSPEEIEGEIEKALAGPGAVNLSGDDGPAEVGMNTTTGTVNVTPPGSVSGA